MTNGIECSEIDPNSHRNVAWGTYGTSNKYDIGTTG